MVSSIEFRVLRASDGDTHYDEVVALIDGNDHLAILGRGRWHAWMGLAPEDSSDVHRSLAIPQAPADRIVARCNCTHLACDALIARVQVIGERVIWDDFKHGSDVRADRVAIPASPVVFDRDEYAAALHGATPRSAWEPTTRRAAILAEQQVRQVDLESVRLRPGGFWPRGDDEIVGMALLGRKGDADHSLLTFGVRLQSKESAASLGMRAAEALRSGAVLEADGVDRKPLARPGQAGLHPPR